jgi:hypothetical protein
MPYKDKVKLYEAQKRYRAKSHTSSYYLRKARDALLLEGSEEGARSLEDDWGVLVSTRPKFKEVKSE